MRLRELIAALALGLSGATAAADPPTLTVATWGGAYEAAQRAALFAPFEAATGIQVETVPYGGGVRALADHLDRAGPPEWGGIDMIRADAEAACARGLLEPRAPGWTAPAPDGTPPARDFIEGALAECSVGQLVFATVIAYDDRAFPGEKPRSVADFFDTEAFPGKRALRRAPVGLLEWALRSYGVPRTQIYDLLSTERGLSLAFRRLDRIRPDTVWWRAGSAPVEMLERGEVAMATGFNGRFFTAQAIEGAPISVIWDGALLEMNDWAIPRGTQDAALARRFIRFATAPARLAGMSNRISYGPTRASAQRRVGLHAGAGIPMRPHMPTTPRHMARAIRKDDRWYAQTEALRQRRFRAWLERGEDTAPTNGGG